MARKDKQSAPLLPSVSYVDILKNLACEMIDYDGVDPEVPKDFITRTLIDRGRVGFWDTDTPARGFYESRAFAARTRYRTPDKFVYYTGAGERSFDITTAQGARDIRANATATPLLDTFKRYAHMLEICDRSIIANTRAQVFGRIIKADGHTAKDSATLEMLLDKLESGKPLVLDADTVAALGNLEPVDISIPYTAPAVIAAKGAIWSEAVKMIGSVAQNQYRRERTQTAEVDAAIGESIDLVYILIDTFNADCERQNITARDGTPTRARFNGYAAKFDTEPVEPAQTPQEPQEGGGGNG